MQVASNARCAAAIDVIAIASRSCGSCCISEAKPAPSGPSRFSRGISTSARNSSEVSALGLAVQASDLLRGQRQPASCDDELAGLGRREPQLARADLEQLAVGAQARQPELRNAARADNDHGLRRQTHDHAGDEREHRRAGDRLHVVDEERERHAPPRDRRERHFRWI